MMILFWVLAYLFMGWVSLIIFFATVFPPDPKRKFELDDPDITISGLICAFWPFALIVLLAAWSVKSAYLLGMKYRKKGKE